MKWKVQDLKQELDKFSLDEETKKNALKQRKSELVDTLVRLRSEKNNIRGIGSFFKQSGTVAAAAAEADQNGQNTDGADLIDAGAGSDDKKDEST